MATTTQAEARSRFALFFYGMEFTDLSNPEQRFIDRQVAAEEAGTYEYVGPVTQFELDQSAAAWHPGRPSLQKGPQ